jgi:signal transduction histidine kinase
VYVSEVLETVFLNVLDNAVDHNDDSNPHVWVTVETDEETVTVEFADDGPGIDDYERSVIERGTENSLQHSSGLGLWLIKWGTEIADGTVTFRENDPTGTVLTITVPTVDPAAKMGTDLERLLEP